MLMNVLYMYVNGMRVSFDEVCTTTYYTKSRERLFILAFQLAFAKLFQ